MSTGHEAAAGAPNAGEYVLHHLANFNSSGHPQTQMVDFSIINYDTVFFSVLLGAIGLFCMWMIARKSTSGVPGRAQAALEILVEMDRSANQQMRANLDQILTKARARNLPVLLIGLPGPANFGPDWKAEFDAIYPELAAKHATLLAPNFLEGLGASQLGSADPAALQSLMQPDQIHPNAEGVKRIVAHLGPQVQALLGQIPPQ